MKKIRRRFKRFIKKVLTKKKSEQSVMNKIIKGATFLLVAGAIIVLGVKGYNIFKSISDDRTDAEAFRNLRDSAVNAQNTYTIASIEKEEKQRVIEQLDKAQKHMEQLGKIEVYKGNVSIDHTERFDDGELKYSIRKKGMTDYMSHIRYVDMKFSLGEDNTIKIGIRRPYFIIDDVYLDTNTKLKVLDHPNPSAVDGYKEPMFGPVGKFLEATLFNDNVKGGSISQKEVDALDAQWLLNARQVGLNTINSDLMTDKEFTKKLEDIHLNVVKNMYSLELDPYISADEKEVVTKVSLPLDYPVEVYFIN